uniref:Secreted protein n=1 Tax=Ditylenchus dipsaci TaxID=166011 RepID=A0A915D239_9BILA
MINHVLHAAFQLLWFVLLLTVLITSDGTQSNAITTKVITTLAKKGLGMTVPGKVMSLLGAAVQETLRT